MTQAATESAAAILRNNGSSTPEFNLKFDRFSYLGHEKVILKNIDLSIKAGESVAIMGGSGSGKTTLLKIFAGIDGYKPVNWEGNTQGRFAMLFQQNLLLDYKKVYENIILPAKFNRSPVDVMPVVKALGIADLLERYPFQLSGGQQKRVALARALLYPNIDGLIMDEPFSGLDEPLREGILEDLRKRLRNSGLTCLFATHSAYEAASLANRVVFIGGDPSTISLDDNIILNRDEWPDIQNKVLFQKVSEIMKRQRNILTVSGK